MHIWMYICGYICNQTYMSMCMYVCLCACMHTNLYSHVTVHIFDMSLKKYSWHITNMSHTTIMLYWHIANIFAYMWQNSINCNIYVTGYCHVWASNKYASQMPCICHICKLVYVYITQLCQHQYLIWTHYSQQYDHKHCYTYTSHNVHMPQKKIFLQYCIYMSPCPTKVVYI